VTVSAIARRARGPYRSRSWRSYVRAIRAAAFVALLALVGGVISDAVGGGFWERHGLIAGVAASLIVVLLSVGIVDETIARRGRGRWRVLAHYVMLELVLNARLIWTDVAELAGKMPSGIRTASVLDSGGQVVRDTPSLTEAVRELLDDPERRGQLHEGFAQFVSASDEMLGRWADVMLNVDIYAELVDRHVELATKVSWLESLLDATDGITESGEGQRARRNQRVRRNHPAIQFEGQIEDDRLASRIVSITQLAEGLDRLTLKLAQEVVPVNWWAERLGMTTVVWSAISTVSSTERANS
jgi:hypothetical protein